VIGCFYLRLKFQNHCSQYATYYSCKYKPILFPICCFLLTRIHNSPKLSSTFRCFFLGEFFCTTVTTKIKVWIVQRVCLVIYIFFVKFAKNLRKHSLKLSHFIAEGIEITRTKWDSHKVLLPRTFSALCKGTGNRFQ
jgi:hypothetical protein